MVETDRKLLIVNTRGIGERIVRNDEVVGSIPTSSTKTSNLYVEQVFVQPIA